MLIPTFPAQFIQTSFLTLFTVLHKGIQGGFTKDIKIHHEIQSNIWAQ